MNFDDNFRRIGSTNVEPAKALIKKLDPDAWENEEIRQQRYEAHRDTRTIPLVHDYDFRHSQPTRHPALQIFEPTIRPALGMTADFYDKSEKGKQLTEKNGLGYFIRCNLVLLKAGGAITEHRDMNFSLTHAHRVHVPIITNDQVWFTVGGETLNIPEGEIYEINNRRPHAVRNDGDEDRVHLIMDYVLKGEMCCCGEKLHPDTPCSPSACIETDLWRTPCTCFGDSQ